MVVTRSQASPRMRVPDTDVWSIKKLLVQPLDRLATDTPTWGWALAWLGGFWQWLRGDAFSSLLALIVLIAAADYYWGVKAARLSDRFNPLLAQRGWHGKMSGVVLLLGVRLFEGWGATAGFVDSKGGIATALGVALLSVDLQSIAHHRESFGAAPIPILSAILAWMRSVVAVKLPPPRRTVADGAWNDPNTWANQRVPDVGDRVSIRHNVTFDIPPDAATADEAFDRWRQDPTPPPTPPTT